jgi:hypothetical protein
MECRKEVATDKTIKENCTSLNVHSQIVPNRSSYKTPRGKI